MDPDEEVENLAGLIWENVLKKKGLTNMQSFVIVKLTSYCASGGRP